MPIGAQQRYYLKLKAVYYYYEKDYTQTEIAKMLNVSRITLGRLLREAREEGMVKIDIIDQRNVKHLLEVEARLKDRFGLSDVKIADCVENDQEEITRKVAMAGARYVEHILRPGTKVGLAWGRTLEMMVDFLGENRSVSGLEVVTLLGGAGTADTVTQPNIIAQRFIQKYDGVGYIINAPYLCQSEELCSAIKQEPHIADALRRSKDSDITLVGIGESPDAGEGLNLNVRYGSEVVNELVQNKAVGDICANFFDISGEPCSTSVSKKVVSIDLADLREHKKVIAISGGPKKHASVLGALRGGYVDVLITDKFTAEGVLERSK